MLPVLVPTPRFSHNSRQRRASCGNFQSQRSLSTSGSCRQALPNGNPWLHNAHLCQLPHLFNFFFPLPPPPLKRILFRRFIYCHIDTSVKVSERENTRWKCKSCVKNQEVEKYHRLSSSWNPSLDRKTMEVYFSRPYCFSRGWHKTTPEWCRQVSGEDRIFGGLIGIFFLILLLHLYFITGWLQRAITSRALIQMKIF